MDEVPPPQPGGKTKCAQHTHKQLTLIAWGIAQQRQQNDSAAQLTARDLKISVIFTGYVHEIPRNWCSLLQYVLRRVRLLARVAQRSQVLVVVEDTGPKQGFE